MKDKTIKVLGIIPARGGSKSIPHKNIVPLLGKPLIAHAILAAKKSRRLDATIVSTDDPRIAAVAKKYGADVPFLRPAELSGDSARDIGFLQHALHWLEQNRGWKPEIVVFLQPTSPGRTGRDIDAVLDFMEKEKADSVRTMFDTGHFNPFKMWVEKKHEILAPLISMTPYRKLGMDAPRQKLPRYFSPFGLVYATKAKFIKRGRVWGPKMKAFLLPSERIVDIDTPADLKEAERKLRKLSKKYK